MNDSPLPTTTTATVDIQSAWISKINWTQVVAVLASLLAVWGFKMTPEQQVSVVMVIQMLQGAVTWYFKTYRTTTITQASAKKIG